MRLLVTAVAVVVTTGWSELRSREGDSAEQLTGIFRAAARGIAAFLGWNGIVQHGHDQLGIPLQPDNGKLSQRHMEPAVFRSQYQRFVEDV